MLRGSRVSVVESAEVRNRDDLAGSVFDRAWRWRVATETQVSARLVVVSRVSKQDPKEMTFAEGDDVVGALSTNRSDDALRVGILPWRLLALITSTMPIAAIFFLNNRP